MLFKWSSFTLVVAHMSQMGRMAHAPARVVPTLIIQSRYQCVIPTVEYFVHSILGVSATHVMAFV